MFLDNLFQLIGQSLTFVVLIILGLLIISLILGIILLKKDKLIFPKFIIFVLDVFYSPLKTLARWLGFDDVMVDQMGVEVRNKVNKNTFEKTSNNEKIIVLPHCLRHRDCEARLGETGLVCSKCGKCSIGVIKDKAEEIGYKTFIVPGSSFVKKIIEDNEFESVVGIACYEDLNMTMMKLSDFAPQGVLLSRTGCFETKVDVKTVLEKIGYYDNKEKPINKLSTEFCIKDSKASK